MCKCVCVCVYVCVYVYVCACERNYGCMVAGQTAVEVAVESGSICLKIVLESKAFFSGDLMLPVLGIMKVQGRIFAFVI